MEKESTVVLGKIKYYLKRENKAKYVQDMIISLDICNYLCNYEDSKSERLYFLLCITFKHTVF